MRLILGLRWEALYRTGPAADEGVRPMGAIGPS